MSNTRTTIRESFFKTLGAVGALFIVAFMIVAVVFLHDSIYLSHYSNKISYSQDNNWGALKVSVKQDAWDVSKAKKAWSEPCTETDTTPKTFPNGKVMSLAEWLCDKDPATGKYITQHEAEDAYVDISGEVFVKNRSWNKSLQISERLVQLKCNDGKYYSATLNGMKAGHFLGARHGASGKFELYRIPCSKGGILVVNSGDNQATVE